MHSPIYVAYITSGRDKHEYDTLLVGAFSDENVALKKIFTTLVNKDMVLCRELCEDLEGELIKDVFKYKASYDEYMDLEHYIFPFHLLKPDIDLEQVIRDYDDSYYKDGWDYTSKEVQVQ